MALFRGGCSHLPRHVSVVAVAAAAAAAAHALYADWSISAAIIRYWASFDKVPVNAEMNVHRSTACVDRHVRDCFARLMLLQKSDDAKHGLEDKETYSY